MFGISDGVLTYALCRIRHNWMIALLVVTYRKSANIRLDCTTASKLHYPGTSISDVVKAFYGGVLCELRWLGSIML